MWLRLVAGMAAVLSLSACSHMESWGNDISCKAGRDCEVKMGRAQAFVIKHSQASLKTASSRTIETSNGGDGKILLHFIVRKRAQDQSHDVITAYVDCGSFSGCIGDPHLMADNLLSCIESGTACE